MSLFYSSQEHVLSQSQSQYIKARVKTSHHIKKTDAARDSLKKSCKLLAIKKQQLAQGQQELAELERTWRSYEKEQQAAHPRRSIELREDQVSVGTNHPPSKAKTQP